MSENQRTVSGTLMRGADGSLYFIPDSVLEPFRVFDSEQSRIEGLLTGEAVDQSLVNDAQAAVDVQAVYTTITLSEPKPPELVGRVIGSFLLMTE
jgi:hypothetical protein